MYRRPTIAALMTCAALAACSGGERDRATNVAHASKPTSAGDTATPAREGAASSPPATQQMSASETLPLRRGVYVAIGTGCASPPNAAIQIFDGSGISGATTRACHNRIISRDRDSYVTDQSCENTYDGSRTTERQQLRIPDDRHFTDIGEGGSVTYAMCPRGTAPAELETIAG